VRSISGPEDFPRLVIGDRGQERGPSFEVGINSVEGPEGIVLRDRGLGKGGLLTKGRMTRRRVAPPERWEASYTLNGCTCRGGKAPEESDGGGTRAKDPNL